MTLKEAIDFNTALRKDLVAKELLTFAEALQLGIEALKRVQDCRQVMCDFAPVLLPGETKE